MLSFPEIRWELTDSDTFHANFLPIRKPLRLIQLLIFWGLLKALEVQVELQSVMPSRHGLRKLLLEYFRFLFSIWGHHSI